MVQDILDPPRIGLIPEIGLSNRQQLGMLDVLGAAVLGTWPVTAPSPPNELE